MLVIDLPIESRELGEELEKHHPGLVAVVDGRAIDGTLTHWSLFFSAAAMVVPEIRKIAIEILQSKRHKSFSFKGVKFQGYSDEEIKNVLSKINEISKQ